MCASNLDWVLRTRLRWELIRYTDDSRLKYHYLGSLNKTWDGWIILQGEEQHIPECSYLPYDSIKPAARRLMYEAAEPTE